MPDSDLVNGNITRLHVIPKVLQGLVRDPTIHVGIDGNSKYCWALTEKHLHLWKFTDGVAAWRHELNVPFPLTGRSHVHVVSHSGISAVSVLLCSSQGRIAFWVDISQSSRPHVLDAFDISAGSGDPLVASVAAVSSESITGPSTLGAISAVDGNLYMFQGTGQGLYLRHLSGHQGTSHSLGMVGRLGSVLKAAYSEAFDPLWRVQRSGASSLPAVQMCLNCTAVNRYKLLVLTAEALDCWLISSLPSITHQLLWSCNIGAVVQSMTHVAATSFLALGVGPQQQHIYLWSHSSLRDGTGQHAAHVFSLKSETIPMYESSIVLEGFSLTSDLTMPGWSLVVNGDDCGCLLRAPDGVVVEWSLEEEEAQLVARGQDLRAVSTFPERRAWLLLVGAYGVLEMTPQHMTNKGRPEGPLSAEERKEVVAFLDLSLAQMSEADRVGCPSLPLARGLSQALKQWGVLDSTTGINLQVLVEYSQALVDKVAKRGLVVGEVRTADDVMFLDHQLSEKLAGHRIYLIALHQSGALQQLSPGQVRQIFEHHEKLGAMARVRELQVQLQARNTGEVAMSDAEKEGYLADGGELILAVLKRASVLRDAPEAMPDLEMFYQHPTRSASYVFRAVGDHAWELEKLIKSRGANLSQTALLIRTQVLSQVLQALVAGAEQAALFLRDTFPRDSVRQAELTEPSWTWDDTSRTAWQTLADLNLTLRDNLNMDPGVIGQWSRLFLEVAGAALVAYQQAVAAAVGSNQLQLLAAYRELRHRCVRQLTREATHQLKYQEAQERVVSDQVVGNLPSFTAEGKEAAAREDKTAQPQALIWQVETLAAAHHCFKELYEICEYLVDNGLDTSQRTERFMKTLASEPGASSHDTFSRYVFDHLREAGKLSELLAMCGGDLGKELGQYLLQYPDVEWMMFVKNSDFLKCTETLIKLSLGRTYSCAEKRKLLCLARIAAHAAGNEGVLCKTAVADRDQSQVMAVRTTQEKAREEAGDRAEQFKDQASKQLQLLAIQEDTGQWGSPPLGPLDLASQALKENPALGLECLLLGESSARAKEGYEDLWSSVWREILLQTDMESIARSYERHSMGDPPEVYDNALMQTPLYIAIRTCVEKHQREGQLTRRGQELLEEFQVMVKKWSSYRGNLERVVDVMRKARDDGLWCDVP